MLVLRERISGRVWLHTQKSVAKILASRNPFMESCFNRPDTANSSTKDPSRPRHENYVSTGSTKIGIPRIIYSHLSVHYLPLLTPPSSPSNPHLSISTLPLLPMSLMPPLTKMTPPLPLLPTIPTRFPLPPIPHPKPLHHVHFLLLRQWDRRSRRREDACETGASGCVMHAL